MRSGLFALFAAASSAFHHNDLGRDMFRVKPIIEGPDCDVVFDSEGWFCAQEDEVMSAMDAMNCLVTGECAVPDRFDLASMRLRHPAIPTAIKTAKPTTRPMQVFDSEGTFEVA